MNNNYGYVQRDAAGNSATLMNQNGSDVLQVGDVNHTDQIRLTNSVGNVYVKAGDDTPRFGLMESDNTERMFMEYDSGLTFDSDSTIIFRANNTSGAQNKTKQLNRRWC